MLFDLFTNSGSKQDHAESILKNSFFKKMRLLFEMNINYAIIHQLFLDRGIKVDFHWFIIYVDIILTSQYIKY